MKTIGKMLLSSLLVLMMTALLMMAMAEDASAWHGALTIEMDADNLTEEVSCSVSSAGEGLLDGTMEGLMSADSAISFMGLPEDSYVVSLKLPEDVVLTSLNGYATEQRGIAQWIASVKADAESLYVVRLEKTGAVTGGFEQLPDAVSVSLTGPRCEEHIMTSSSYTIVELLPDIYTVTVQLPAGLYEDNASEGTVTYRENTDGTITAELQVNVRGGEKTSVPVIRRIVSGSLKGTVTGTGKPLAGVTVILMDESGAEVAKTETDANGSWLVADLPFGAYTVRYTAERGALIPDSQVIINAQMRHAAVSASAAVPASMTLFAFNDNNNNGTQSKNEGGVPDVKIELVSAEDGRTVLASGMTGDDGYVTLTAPAGAYRVRATAPEGYGYGKKGTAVRFTHSIMSESQEIVQESDVYELRRDEVLELGLGMERLASVSGHYWHDLNNDGFWQEDEPGLAGVRVTITGVRNGSHYEGETDENGAFIFERLKTGSYDLTYYVPDGYVFTVKASGDVTRRSRMTTEAKREDSDRFTLERGEVLEDRNVGLMTECVIEGVCFLDANYNGIFDEGEQVLPGVELNLSRQSNNVLLQTVESDENGRYRFDGLRGSTFGIRALLPQGMTYTVAVEDPEGNRFPENNGKRERKIGNITVEDSGYERVLLGAIRYGAITGVVYYDDNFTSAWESGEKIIQGRIVTLMNAQGDKIASVKTAKSGAYTFSSLTPGQYRISMKPVDGYAFTTEGAGSILHNLADGTGESELISLPLGETLDHMDIGLIEPASVRGVAFADANDNGLYERNEEGLRGTVVKLMTATGMLAETEVDKNGEFSFEALMPGRYYLRYELPENGVFSPRVEGGNAVVGEGSIGAGDWFELNAGDAYEAPVCGGLDLGVISGFTYADPNGNGVMDAEEATLAGMTITITPSRSDLKEKTVVTGVDGAFRLEGLRPDTYVLTVVCPADCVLSRLPGVTLGLKNGLETQSVQLTVGMGAQWEDQRLGCVMPSTWSGTAYYDENNDGLRGESEAPAAGEIIILRDADTGDNLLSTVTGADGSFTVEGIAPGRYVLVFPLSEGLRTPKEGDSHFTEQNGELISHVMEIKESSDYCGVLLSVVRETTLAGHVWLEQGGETSPVADAKIKLMNSEGAVVGEMTTVEDGAYAFDGLMPGFYTIDAILPEGRALVKSNDDMLAENNLVSILSRTSGTQGSSGVITVKMAQHQLELDIGSVLPGRLGDRCWLDLNGNGLQDGDEGGLPGVSIELLRDGEVVATTVSDQYGYYTFQNIYPTTYTLRVTWPGEVKPTTLRPDLKLIVSVLQEDGTSIPVEVESNASNYNADLGFVLLDKDHLPEGYGEGDAQKWKKK